MRGTGLFMISAFEAETLRTWASTESPQKVIFEDRGPESPLAFTPEVDPKQEVILV